MTWHYGTGVNGVDNGFYEKKQQQQMCESSNVAKY